MKYSISIVSIIIITLHYNTLHYSIPESLLGLGCNQPATLSISGINALKAPYIASWNGRSSSPVVVVVVVIVVVVVVIVVVLIVLVYRW